jgi:hypothetical protein
MKIQIIAKLEVKLLSCLISELQRPTREYLVAAA